MSVVRGRGSGRRRLNDERCLAAPFPEIPRRYMTIIPRFVPNYDFQINQLSGIQYEWAYFPEKANRAKTKLYSMAVRGRVDCLIISYITVPGYHSFTFSQKG